MTRLCVAIAGLALVAGCTGHDHHRDSPLVNIVLRKMTIAVKTYATVNGTFPIGTSKQLPSSNATDTVGKGCCGSKSSGSTVDHKCPVSKDFATDPIWSTLEISIDEPSWHRFTYESKDGKTFVITAEGDLDCDGDVGAYVLSGSLDAQGASTTTVTRQPPNEY